MIDIHIRRTGPLGAIIRARPRTTRRVASRVDRHARAVALQHVLSRVAGPRDGVPRREQVPVVGAGVGGRGDGQGGEL